MTTRLLLATTTALLASSCASVPADGGRARVRADVEARLGLSPADRAAAAPTAPAAEGDAAPDLRALLSAPLTADRAAQIVLTTHPRVQAALGALGLARADVLTGARIANPTAEGELFFGEADDEVGVELSVRQSLTSLLYASKRGAVARAQLAAEEQRAAEEVLALVFGARRAFVSWQAAAERTELARTLLQASDAAYEAARALHASGNLTELRLLGEQDLLERAKLALHDAQLARDAARAHLDAALGLWGESTTWTAEAALPPPTRGALDADAAEREAVERSLVLARRRHQLAATDAAGGLATTEGWLPDIEVGVAARREPGHDWAVGPSLEIELPLFDRGGGPRARADAQHLQLRDLYTADAVELRAAARAAAVRVAGLAERARHFIEVVGPLRARIVTATELHVNAMDASVFDLISAQRAQLEARRGQVDALERYWLARAELDRMLAGGRARGTTDDTASDEVADTAGAAAPGGH